MNFEFERSHYALGTLDEAELPTGPLDLLCDWLREATDCGCPEPTAMALATASAEGRPSNRFVLVRGLSEDGIEFFTNYLSRKGNELAENPFAAATFWWPLMERQIRLEGRVEKLTAAESDAYFNARPLESQRASAASPQSQVVESREALERLIEQFPASGPVERPAHWGGYRLIPGRIEFWQGRPARLHDRVLYERQDDGTWTLSRLAP